MAAVGDILRRFRFHGVPGAPAPVGVPVDRTAELQSELAPVFLLLEAAQDRAGVLLEEATTQAASLRAEAVERARRIVLQARADAAAARAESAASRLSRAENRRLELFSEAKQEADRIARVATERTPALTEQIVRRILSMRKES